MVLTRSIVRRKLLFVLLAIWMSPYLRAQTAEDIINQHVEAVGGRAVISRIKSISLESSVQIQGTEAPSSLTILNGKGFRLESEFNGQKIIQVYTDKSGWTLNPMSGSADPEPLPADQYKAGKDQIDIGGPLYNYSSKGNKVEYLGKEEGLLKIRSTSRDNITSFFFIDPLNYLIVKTVQTGSMMGQVMEITRTYSNFRKTDFGYVIPYTTDINYGGSFNLTSTLRKVEFNREIDPAIFEMPGK